MTPPITSTAELHEDLRRYARRYREAAHNVGLTPREYDRFLASIRERRAGYARIPRYLDAMSWASGDRVFAVRNVEIPEGTFGWWVRIVEDHDVVDVFIPNRCGNLAVIRTPIAHVARTVNFVKRFRPFVAKPRYVAQVPSFAPHVDGQPGPIAQPPAVHRIHPMLALLLLPLIALAESHHGGGPPAVLLPVGCTTPAAR